MTEKLRFVVPGPPIPYQRVVHVRRAKRAGKLPPPFQPKGAKRYQNHVALCALVAAQNQRWVVPTKKQRLHLYVRVYRTARRGDLSNFVKILEDGINDAKRVWIDDRYVVSINAGMAVSKSKPRMEVEITILEDPS